MNERISTEPHCFLSFVGAAGYGKTQLVGRMISNQEKKFHHASQTLSFYKVTINREMEQF